MILACLEALKQFLRRRWDVCFVYESTIADKTQPEGMDRVPSLTGKSLEPRRKWFQPQVLTRARCNMTFSQQVYIRITVRYAFWKHSADVSIQAGQACLFSRYGRDFPWAPCIQTFSFDLFEENLFEDFDGHVIHLTLSCRYNDWLLSSVRLVNGWLTWYDLT
jgi:hypothetical protein